MSPLTPADQVHWKMQSVENLTKLCFDPKNFMASCDVQSGIYKACVLMYGGLVTYGQAKQSITLLPAPKINPFLDEKNTAWTKITLNDKGLKTIPKSILARSSKMCYMASNNTSVKKIFYSMGQKFDKLYPKRSFVHWFLGEGMEEGQMSEARENNQAIAMNYEPIGNPFRDIYRFQQEEQEYEQSNFKKIL